MYLSFTRKLFCSRNKLACASVRGNYPFKNILDIRCTSYLNNNLRSTITITGFEIASNILYYQAWVNGRNCDLPYIKVTTLKNLEGAKVLAWLNPDSSTSTGWRDASIRGLSYTTNRSGACVGGPYCGKSFTYEVQLIYKNKKYLWSFYGYAGSGSYWSKCTTHTPKQLSFKEIDLN